MVTRYCCEKTNFSASTLLVLCLLNHHVDHFLHTMHRTVHSVKKTMMTIFFLCCIYFSAILFTRCREDNGWGRVKETKKWGVLYDEERKESLKNVKGKPCKKVGCCLSNKLEGKMTSCSPFLFVQTLLYKVTYVSLSESMCVCWIVMLCIHSV